MKGLGPVLAIVLAGVWLNWMVGVHWYTAALPVAALLGLAVDYGFSSSRTRSRP
jgi:hypothetical protein